MYILYTYDWLLTEIDLNKKKLKRETLLTLMKENGLIAKTYPRVLTKHGKLNEREKNVSLLSKLLYNY